MSARKGSNGIADGKENEQKFLEWESRTEDFKPYIWQGLLNQSRIARECGFGRQVFDTNEKIRDEHLPALEKRLEDEGVLRPRVANPVREMQRQRRGNAVSDARIKQIQEEAEAVKAENRELRKQLERLEGIDEILHETGRVPW